MTGGYVNETAAIEASIHLHAFIVYRLVHQRRATACQHPPQIRISRLLDGHRHSRIHQQFTQNVECLLCSDSNKDFIRTRLDTSPRQDPGTNLLDKHRIIGVT